MVSSTSREKKDSLRDGRGRLGRRKIFEDSETPVFSVDLEKAAFTAKRCNLSSSHEWETGPLVMLPWGHMVSERARLRGRSYLDLFLSIPLPLSLRYRCAFAWTTGGFRHVRGILFALSHRLQLTSCLAILSDRPRITVVGTCLSLFRNSQASQELGVTSNSVIPMSCGEIKRKVNDKNSNSATHFSDGVNVPVV